jgi:guanylate kinase
MNERYKPLVLIISAPSGSGKSTLVNQLLQLVPKLDFSISYTTRAPRGKEVDGKQYRFVPLEEFKNMIAANEFLEYAEVFGKYYGTARRFLREAEQSGHDLLLDIDVQGAAQIKRKLPDAVSIFVLPPNRKTLEKRLRERGEDAEDVIERRLVTASGEIENYDKYDYILINDVLDESIASLQSIVSAERLRYASRALTEEENETLRRAERSRLANVSERVQPILESFGLRVRAPG